MNDNGDSTIKFQTETLEDLKKKFKKTAQSASDFEDTKKEISSELTSEESNKIFSQSTDLVSKSLDVNEGINELSEYIKNMASVFEENLKSQSGNSNSINKRGSLSSPPNTRPSRARSVDYNNISSLNFPNVPYDTPRSFRSRSSSVGSDLSSLSAPPNSSDDFIAIMLNVIADKVDTLDVRVGVMEDSLIKLANAFQNKNLGFGDRIKDSFNKAINSMKKPFVALGEAYDKLKETLSNGVEKVGDFFKDIKDKFLDSLKKCKDAVHNSVNSALESAGKVLMFPVKKVQQMNRSIEDLAHSIDIKVKNFADEVRISALERKKSLVVGGSKIEDALHPGKTYDRVVSTIIKSDDAAKSERYEDKSDSRKMLRSISNKVDKINTFDDVLEALVKNQRTAEDEVNKCMRRLKEAITPKEDKAFKKDLADSQKNLAEITKTLKKCTNYYKTINSTVVSHNFLENEISNIKERIENRNNSLASKRGNNNLEEKSQSKSIPQYRDRTQSLSEESPQLSKTTLQRSSLESDATISKAVKRQAPTPPTSSQKPESTISKAVKRQAPTPPTSSQKPESTISKAVKRQAPTPPTPPKLPNPPSESNNKSEGVSSPLLDRIIDAKKGLVGVKSVSTDNNIKAQSSPASSKNLRSTQRG